MQIFFEQRYRMGSGSGTVVRAVVRLAATAAPLLQSYHWQLQLKHFISVNWLNLIAEKSIEIKLF